MTKLPDRGVLAGRSLPGVLQLLEAGELNEDQPQPETLPTNAASRGVRLNELKRRWQVLIRSLSGYRASEVILRAKPIWIPIVELHVLPHGKATLSYQQTSSATMKPELKIFGIGFGTSGVITFSESIAFDADQTGKSLQAMMLASATRYTHPTKKSFIRLDIESPRDGVEYKVEDLPPVNHGEDADSLDPGEWEVIQRVKLSSSHDRGQYIWQYKAEERSNWKVGIGLEALKAIGFDLNLDLEVEQAREFDVKFEMPYGHDYVFYARAGESPLVPFCAIERS